MVIRFGLIEPRLISDWVLVANKNYGNGIGGFGSRPVYPNPQQLKRNYDFYSKLEDSILKEGIRNPIFCNCISEGTFSRVGVSRLWIAKKLKIRIPVIIADYVDGWADLEVLETEADIKAKFQDQPFDIELKEDNLWIGGLPHYHLDEPLKNLKTGLINNYKI